jgi:hypothetical protein
MAAHLRLAIAADGDIFPSMRGLLLVVLGAAALETACSRSGFSRPGGNVAVVLPVAATSMSTVYGIQLGLRGSAVVRDGWVYVDIPDGSARTYQGRATAWDLLVRAGIATCDGRNESRLIAEGRAARIAPLVGLTRDNPELDTVTRKFTAPLHVEVGIPPGTDLDRSWVTIEVSWPIESVIASYSVAATGGLVGGVPAPVADGATRTSDARSRAGAYDLDVLGVRAPPPRIRCS